MEFYKVKAEMDELQGVDLNYSHFDIAFNKFQGLIASDTCVHAELWNYIENPKTFTFMEELFDEYDRYGRYTLELRPTIAKTKKALEERMLNMRQYMKHKYQLELSETTIDQITLLCDKIVDIVTKELEEQGVI